MMIIIFDNRESIAFHDDLTSFTKRKQMKEADISSWDNFLQYGNLEIAPLQRTLKLNGYNIKLTKYEFEILYLLAKNPGQVFSKKQIYNQVWNMPYFDAEDNVVSLIYRIR